MNDCSLICSSPFSSFALLSSSYFSPCFFSYFSLLPPTPPTTLSHCFSLAILPLFFVPPSRLFFYFTAPLFFPYPPSFSLSPSLSSSPTQPLLLSVPCLPRRGMSTFRPFTRSLFPLLCCHLAPVTRNPLSVRRVLPISILSPKRINLLIAFLTHRMIIFAFSQSLRINKVIHTRKHHPFHIN